MKTLKSIKRLTGTLNKTTISRLTNGEMKHSGGRTATEMPVCIVLAPTLVVNSCVYCDTTTVDFGVSPQSP